MVQRQTGRKVVQLGEVRLVHQLQVAVLLVDVVGLQPVLGVEVVERTAGHQRDVRAVVGVENEGVLHIGLVAAGLDTYLKWIVYVWRRVVVLPTVALLVEQSDAAVEDIDRAEVVPAVLQVYLAHVRLVEESVVVVVMVPPVVLVLPQYLGVHLSQVDVAVGIGL